MTEQLCVSCGKEPAEPGEGTVPLCPACKKLAKGEERGIKLRKPKKRHLRSV
jgi:hypothetical protein